MLSAFAHEYAVVLAYLATAADARQRTPAATGPIPPPGKLDQRWEAVRVFTSDPDRWRELHFPEVRAVAEWRGDCRG